MRSLLVAAVVLGGCTATNPNFCPGVQDNNCRNVDAGPDAPIRCENADDCTGSDKVCKLPAGVCVECETSATCTTATEPICDTTANECIGCRGHADCPMSGACLPDGSCAAAAQVAYASPTGGGTACTLGMPCATLLDALAKNLPVVKLMGPGIVAGPLVTAIDRKVTIVADPGTILDRTLDGAILLLNGSADVSISDLEISGAGGLTTGEGILMPNLGGAPKLTLERVSIYANNHLGLIASSGRVVIRRSVFAGNVGGGANISMADFDITNSLFVANGSTTATTGGLTLLPLTTAYSFAFNTISDNVSATTQPINGVLCTGLINLSNSIVSRNAAAANCMFSYTLFDTGTVVSGTNLAGAPAFRNTDVGIPTNPNFYRIGATSAAKDRADPAGVATVDIDGNQRPQGAGKDMGADEVTP